MEVADEIGISQAQVSRLEKKRPEVHEKLSASISPTEQDFSTAKKTMRVHRKTIHPHPVTDHLFYCLFQFLNHNL